MATSFCIAVTFLDPQYHGRGDGGEAEWPPSPLRVFQALIAANADQVTEASEFTEALRWLEQLNPPIIVAPRVRQAAPYRLSVPNNSLDVVARSWSRGNYFGGGDASPATHRAMKTVVPQCLLDGETVQYLWGLDEQNYPAERVVAALQSAARRLIALGWGIDLVVGSASIIVDSEDSVASQGEVWRPSALSTDTALRVPIVGTLPALQARHQAFLQRISGQGFLPSDAFTQFGKASYGRATDAPARPYAIFELIAADGSWVAYPQRKLMKMAGMVRHLAIEAMRMCPPPGCDSQWAEQHVAGHTLPTKDAHQQFSYIPLPTIGHRHGDQLIRRVMIAAPIGSDSWLQHLAGRLNGETLSPESDGEFESDEIPRLIHITTDSVTRHYTRRSQIWHSVTPVILPGHDDHKPAKTRKLIERALGDSGIVNPCEYEWSAVSRFRKSYSAHKYDRQKRPTGYLRPDHLLSQTAVHLTLRFSDAEVSGPIVVGAGRHYGFGLMAQVGSLV